MSRNPWSGNPLLRLGAAILAVFVVVGLAAPWVAPYSPTEQLDAVAGKHLPPLSATSSRAWSTGRGSR